MFLMFEFFIVLFIMLISFPFRAIIPFSFTALLLLNVFDSSVTLSFSMYITEFKPPILWDMLEFFNNPFDPSQYIADAFGHFPFIKFIFSSVTLSETILINLDLFNPFIVYPLPLIFSGVLIFIPDSSSMLGVYV